MVLLAVVLVGCALPPNGTPPYQGAVAGGGGG